MFSGSVSLPGIISRSFIALTGLKKCVTAKSLLSLSGMPSDISFNKIPDVFDVKIEVSDLTSSTRFIRSRFASAFSIIASHIQS